MHGIAIDPAVLAMVQPGSKVRFWFGNLTPNPVSEIWHIRAIIDDEQVVYRKWHHKRGWVYFIKSLLSFQMDYASGALEAAK